MLGTVPWWAVTLLGWVFVLGGLGWYFLPDYRPPLPRDAKIRDTSNGLLVGGIGLVLVVTSLFISPWWALLAYAGVIGSATVIRLQIRRHANDLQTFLSETTAAQQYVWSTHPRFSVLLDYAFLQPEVRPLTRLMTRTTNPTTRRMWIRPPPICRLKPRSHKITRTTRTVQSIMTLRQYTRTLCYFAQVSLTMVKAVTVM